MAELYPLAYSEERSDTLVKDIAKAIDARITRVPVLCPHGHHYLDANDGRCSACEATLWWTETPTWCRPYGRVALIGMDYDTESYVVSYISGRYAKRLFRWLLTEEARTVVSAEGADSIIREMVERNVLALPEEELEAACETLYPEEVSESASAEPELRGVGNLSPEETDAVLEGLREWASSLAHEKSPPPTER